VAQSGLAESRTRPRAGCPGQPAEGLGLLGLRLEEWKAAGVLAGMGRENDEIRAGERLVPGVEYGLHRAGPKGVEASRAEDPSRLPALWTVDGNTGTLRILGRPALKVEGHEAGPGYVSGPGARKTLACQAPGVHCAASHGADVGGVREVFGGGRIALGFGDRAARFGGHAHPLLEVQGPAESDSQPSLQTGPPKLALGQQIKRHSQESSGLIMSPRGLSVGGRDQGWFHAFLGSGQAGAAVVLGGDLACARRGKLRFRGIGQGFGRP
jgi:hypothetical protein